MGMRLFSSFFSLPYKKVRDYLTKTHSELLFIVLFPIYKLSNSSDNLILLRTIFTFAIKRKKAVPIKKEGGGPEKQVIFFVWPYGQVNCSP